MAGKTKQRKRGLKTEDAVFDLWEYHLNLENRVLFLGSFLGIDGEENGINAKVSDYFLKGMYALQMNDSTKPVHVVLNSPGGDVTNGLAIYDAMVGAPMDVCIEVYGQASSMGAYVLQAGKTRLLHPSTTIMVHEGSMGVYGNFRDVKNAVRFEENMQEIYYEVLGERTGKGTKYWKKLGAEDRYFTAEQAVKVGLADGIITKNFEDVK